MRLLTTTLAALCALISIVAAAEASEAPRGRSQADEACLTEAIYFEATASSESQVAVGHVILNRASDRRFPNSVCGVVKQGCQFSYRCSGKSLALRDRVKRNGAERAAARLLAGAAADPTNGALFFHSASSRGGGFFAKRPRVGVIGGNVFYR